MISPPFSGRHSGRATPSLRASQKTAHDKSNRQKLTYPELKSVQTKPTTPMQRLFPDRKRSTQTTPRLIPKLEIDQDPSGAVETVQPNGPTLTAKNAFFSDLGTNGRTCFTCHEPQDGWTISADHVRDRFAADVNDPLFRLVDGATCPSDDVSTLQAKRKAYSLLLDKGLIRIGLPVPAAAQFQNLECQRSLWLQHQSGNRINQSYGRNRVCLPPSLASD